MEKTVMGLVAAIGAVAPLSGAHAVAVSGEDAARALQVSSAADLLEPVPNSAAILAALDAAPRAASPARDKGVEVAQFYHHHHWHHHHHFYHHHHSFYHHHHHHYYHHHNFYHHHHHHHYYYRRERPCFYSPLGYICP